jgi:hypothetical protein
MSKQTQFKVAFKKYLNTHSFYTVEEVVTLKMTHNMCKRFFPTVCCMYLVSYVYAIYQTYFYVIFTVF